MIKNFKKFPKNSGVYFFRDKNRRVLYIGKAANLKNRIKSYFSGQKDQRPHTKQASVIKSPDFNNARFGVGARISKMLETAKSIDWQETSSEIEALILESQLIKKYQPPFNVMFRDDKQYFYVGFTNEQFPKILISHQPTTIYRNIEVEIWVGPFTDGNALKTALRLLRRIFPYCTCKQKHNNYCLNYHIGNCLGFCCLNPVRGRPPLGPLEASCETEPSKMPPEPLTGRGGRSHAFGGTVSNGVKKEAIAKQVMVYKKNIAAIKEILSGKKKSLIKRFEKEMNTIARKEKFEKAIELRDKIEKLKMIFKNAQILKEIGRKEIGGLNTLAELKEALHLSAPPRRIEGYDISNIQGEFATGAMVVFTRSASSGQADFQPDKNEYRKFRIRITSKPNDIAMLKEVLTRRFDHPEWQCPDLILIDGGKGQLSAVKAVMSNVKIQMPNKISVIALTKDSKHKGHHIYASTKKSVMPLRNLPPAVRNLILQIDAEAHRFAIGYYRKLHRKNLKEEREEKGVKGEKGKGT